MKNVHPSCTNGATLMVSVSAVTPCRHYFSFVLLHIILKYAIMEIETVDARNERLWQKYLSLLEKQPTLRLSSYLRMARIGLRGFEKWMRSRGYRVRDAKQRILRLQRESEVLAASSFIPVCLNADQDAYVQPHDFLSGINLTLPDGTAISIRRGSAEAVVSFLKLYTGEGSPCSD